MAQVFFCKFCKIFKSTFFTDHLQTTTSEWAFAGTYLKPVRKRVIILMSNNCIANYTTAEAHARKCFVKRLFLNISQNWPDSCDRVTYSEKVKSCQLTALLIQDSIADVFLYFLQQFFQHLFCWTPTKKCLYKKLYKWFNMFKNSIKLNSWWTANFFLTP